MTAALLAVLLPAFADLPVTAGPDGGLVYAVLNERGDVLPDFSRCGYKGGDRAIPDVPARLTVAPGPGDDTARIQAALDTAGRWDWRSDGFRGAVELEAGLFEISGSLRLGRSGVVLRGAGARDAAAGGTELRATGGAEQVVIEVRGSDGPVPEEKTAAAVTDAVVPVGADALHVAADAGFAPGDRVLVRRRGNAAWIAALGMDRIARKAGRELKQWEPFTLEYDRVALETAADAGGLRLTLDAPIPCAIEARWGGGEVVRYREDRRLEKVGVEDLLLVSAFDPAVRGDYDGVSYFADEDHADWAVTVRDARDGWVRRVEARHFVMGLLKAVGGKWITAADCACLDPVSRIEGGRRYAFDLNAGSELCLVRDCRGRYGRHDFVFGAKVCGPNVFLRCRSEFPLANSEPHQRWAVGGLYDNVEAPIAVQDRWNWGTGHGWAGANFVLWNCRGELTVQQPPTAWNYAVGHVGPTGDAYQDRPAGLIASRSRPADPASLYEAQLRDRKSRERPPRK